MIRFIEGSIDVKCENGIVIKNNGMGYFIHVPETSSFHRKEYGDIVKVLTVISACLDLNHRKRLICSTDL